MNATDPNYFFNESVINQTLATVVNGTMTPGHFQVIAEVPGMDLLISIAIVIAIFNIMTFVMLVMGRNLRSKKQ